jgi:uncharacterized protein YdhG (YjbR/CyaY superfamily)
VTSAEQIDSIDAYIDSCPSAVQPILREMRRTILNVIPEATEAMSYRIPTFKVRGKNIVHFAAWKNHVSVYPIPDGGADFEKEIAPYRKGKGTLQFPLGKPVPRDLIGRLTQLRLEEERGRMR